MSGFPGLPAEEFVLPLAKQIFSPAFSQSGATAILWLIANEPFQ